MMRLLRQVLIFGLIAGSLVVATSVFFSVKKVSAVLTNRSSHVIRDIRIQIGSKGKPVTEVAELLPSHRHSFEFWTWAVGEWGIHYQRDDEPSPRTQALDGVYIDVPGSPYVLIEISDETVASTTETR